MLQPHPKSTRCRFDTRAFENTGEGRHTQREEKSQNNQNDRQFNQRKTSAQSL